MRRRATVRLAAVATAAAAAAAALGLVACREISVREQDEAAGLNGGFEVVRAGLPVNWYFHNAPLKRGDFEIGLDPAEAREGRQSLRLVVHRAEGAGGARTPGLFQVVPAASGHSYRVGFWLRNEGATLRLFVRSEKPKEAPEPSIVYLGPNETGAGEWRRFEHVYAVPETYDNVRVELDVLQPGTLWIDDVRVEQIQLGPARSEEAP